MAISLSKRLLCAAGAVRQNSRAADIGTDHALLPIYLIQNEIARYVIASDLRDGPLKAAAANVYEVGLQNKIECRKGDGLFTVQPDEVDDIIVAGMGGELIAKILSQSPWVRDERYRLVLQPMTAAPFLRQYLCENGYRILSETAVADSGHLYTVLSAGYTGSPAQKDSAYYHIGELSGCQGEDAAAYLAWQAARLQKRITGLRASGRSSDEADELESVCGKILKAAQTGRPS